MWERFPKRQNIDYDVLKSNCIGHQYTAIKEKMLCISQGGGAAFGGRGKLY
jgi:hypothetical protein